MEMPPCFSEAVLWPIPYNVFKLSELKNLQVLDKGRVLHFYDVDMRLPD